MSLINEALKKAQKQRQDDAAAQAGLIPPPGLTGSGTPPPPPPPAPASAAPDPDPEPSPMVGARRRRARSDRASGLRWSYLAAGTIAMVVAFVLLRPDPESPLAPPSTPAIAPPIAPAPVTTPAATAAVAPEPAPVATPPATVPSPVAPAPTPAAETTIEIVSFPSPPPTVTRPTTVNPRPLPSVPAGQVLIEDSTTATVNGGSPTTVGGPVPDNAVLDFLERSKVTGVRASDSDPKVLMNDRVYRLNDVVDRDLNLQVVSISPRELQFRDGRGFVYTKAF